MRRVLRSFPEVALVVSQLGRPDERHRYHGIFQRRIFGRSQAGSRNGRGGLTKAGLVKLMDRRLSAEFPGIDFEYSQNIEDNIDEALSGVKGSNSVKVFGPDLANRRAISPTQIMEVMSKVPGIANLAVYRSLGQPNLLITPDRVACARYGLNVGDVAAMVQAAIGGQAVTQVLEGDRRFDLVVRLMPAISQQPGRDSPNPGYPALGRLQYRWARSRGSPMRRELSFIYREGLQRYVPARFAVRRRDLESAVEEAKKTGCRASSCLKESTCNGPGSTASCRPPTAD